MPGTVFTPETVPGTPERCGEAFIKQLNRYNSVWALPGYARKRKASGISTSYSINSPTIT